MSGISSDASTVADRIMSALEDPQWNWRTVDGIRRETGIPPDEIRRFLLRSGRIVVRSVVRDRQGRDLYYEPKALSQKALTDGAPARPLPQDLCLTTVMGGCETFGLGCPSVFPRARSFRRLRPCPGCE